MNSSIVDLKHTVLLQVYFDLSQTQVVTILYPTAEVDSKYVNINVWAGGWREKFVWPVSQKL